MAIKTFILLDLVDLIDFRKYLWLGSLFCLEIALAMMGKPVASIIKFMTSYLRCRTELSRCLWMLSTDTSFDLYNGVNTKS